MQALVRWLDDRPQLSRDVFARGRPEEFAAAIGAEHGVDVGEFSWASLALFNEAEDVVDTAAVYRLRRAPAFWLCWRTRRRGNALSGCCRLFPTRPSLVNRLRRTGFVAISRSGLAKPV
jgi:hypothetical protein